MPEHEVEQVRFATCEPDRMAGKAQRVIVPVEDDARELGMTVAPGVQPILDPRQILAKLFDWVPVGSSQHGTQYRRELLVDRDPARDLGELWRSQVLAGQFNELAANCCHRPFPTADSTTRFMGIWARF